MKKIEILKLMDPRNKGTGNLENIIGNWWNHRLLTIRYSN